MKKSEISLLNVLFCMMVIFIHVTSAALTGVGDAAFIVLYTLQRFCGVAVYGFIFLSGVKLFLKDCSAVSYGKYITSRIMRIYVPYLIATVLYYFFEIWRGYYIFDIKQLIHFVITGKGECHLYFVVIIMQFYLLRPLWNMLLNSRRNATCLVVTALVNVLCVYKLPQLLGAIGIRDFAYNDRVFTSYVFFWFAGCVFGRYYERFVAVFKKILPVMIVLLVITLWADVLLSVRGRLYGIYYPCMDVVHLAYVAVAVFALYSASLIPRATEVCKLHIFRAINSVTFQMYLFHICVVAIVGDFLNKYSSLGHLDRWAIALPSVYIISISLCIIYNKLKNQLERKKLN